MATTVQKGLCFSNAEVNEIVVPQVLIEEDGDSRDSGISMGSEETNYEKKVKIEKLPVRQALSDCTNHVSKKIVHNTSKNGTFFHETPTGRKTKSLFNTENLDQSEYEKKHKEEEREKLTSSHRNSFDDSFNSRKRSSSSSSSISVHKRSKQITIVEDEDEVDDIFNLCDEKETVKSVSLWNVSSCFSKTKRCNSDDSMNGSFRCTTQTTVATRAMSVNVIDYDTPFLEVDYSLPCVEKPQRESQAFRSISPNTLLAEFQRLGDDFHNEYIVIDCRYPYEYNGGHVKGALNVYDKSLLDTLFFPDDPANVIKKRIPIFYCEFSQKRGPSMANTLRSIDRVRNELNYPHVEYPEIYLIDHGYKSLWNIEECRVICEPRNYVPMLMPEFNRELKTFRGATHRSNKSRSELSLAQNGSRRLNSSTCLRRSSSFLSPNKKLHGAPSISAFTELSSEDSFCDMVSKSVTQNMPRSFSSVEIYNEKKSTSEDVGIKVEMVHRDEHVKAAQMTFKTPDFKADDDDESNLDDYLRSNILTPKGKLDFSSLSDSDDC